MTLHTIQKIVLITLFTLSASVFAEDKINWTGPYVGIDLGVGNSQSAYDKGPSDTEHFDQSKTKGIYGLHAGYNFAIDEHLIFGIEGSYQDNFNNSYATSMASLSANRSRNSRINEIWTIVPRLAYGSDKWLGFVKGGFASANFNYFGTDTSLNLITSNINDRTSGWILGVGAEYLLSDHIIAGLEYSHMNFNVGNKDLIPANEYTAGSISNADATIDSLNLRISYKF